MLVTGAVLVTANHEGADTVLVSRVTIYTTTTTTLHRRHHIYVFDMIISFIKLRDSLGVFLHSRFVHACYVLRFFLLREKTRENEVQRES